MPLDQALDVVTCVPSRIATALDRAGGDAGRSPAPGVWSAGAYTWHLVDVLRIGSERLWTIARDPAAGLRSYDENRLGDVRRYAELSPTVAIQALRDAAATWLATARSSAPDASADHDELGRVTAGDVIRRSAHEAQHHLLDVERAAGSPAD
jgi:hypothetical protein